jgi:hypothetical protein
MRRRPLSIEAAQVSLDAEHMSDCDYAVSVRQVSDNVVHGPRRNRVSEQAACVCIPQLIQRGAIAAVPIGVCVERRTDPLDLNSVQEAPRW